jgi:hypothetical protein
VENAELKASPTLIREKPEADFDGIADRIVSFFCVLLIEGDDTEVPVLLQRPFERVIHGLSEGALLNQRPVSELEQQGHSLETVRQHPKATEAAIGDG